MVGVGGAGEGARVSTADGTVVAAGVASVAGVAGAAALQLCSISNNDVTIGINHHRRKPRRFFMAIFLCTRV
jgi:hypothetical protein